MTRLGDSIALRFKPVLGIEFHRLVGRLKETDIEKEAADECPSAALAVVTVHYSDLLLRETEVAEHDLADAKQNVELGSFMILPVEGMNVIENFIVYLSPAHVDNLIVPMVVLRQELRHLPD